MSGIFLIYNMLLFMIPMAVIFRVGRMSAREMKRGRRRGAFDRLKESFEEKEGFN